MTFLLDTSILSETRKRHPDSGLVGWIKATPRERIHVSVLTLGEIEQGVARIRARGDELQAAALERWLRETEAGFANRILPVTRPVASAWGRQQQVPPLPGVDALIAATARVNELTVVTRNTRDFERSGVQVLNPFSG